MIYEVIIVKRAKEDGDEELLLGPIAVAARDDKAAGLGVILDNSHKLEGVLAKDVDVIVRPFNPVRPQPVGEAPTPPTETGKSWMMNKHITGESWMMSKPIANTYTLYNLTSNRT